MRFLIFALFGFGGLAAYWTYCSFTDRDFDTGQRESFNEVEDLENFDDIDEVSLKDNAEDYSSALFRVICL